MLDFFDRQEIARRRTRRLLALFALAVILLILAIYLAVSTLLLWHGMLRPSPGGITAQFWNFGRFVLIAGGILLVIGGGSLYKMRLLRAGGRRVAEILGARPLPPSGVEEKDRRLLNVVEEMALASGIPVPGVYVLDRETGINAFAAGFGLQDAVICVTGGALDLLSRDELQGVVAHEVSHLLQRDTELNTRLLGWLHGLLLLGMIGEMLLRSLRLARVRTAAPALLLGGTLYLLGYLGLFFGRWIKSAVSRQREYLSDAAAVQFTRQPEGLAGALKKVGGITFGAVIVNPRVSELSHMYFCDGVPGTPLFAFLATHPPLEERIRRLDPAFDGRYPRTLLPAKPTAPPPPRPRSSTSQSTAVSGAAALAILETVGAPMREHAERVRELLAQAPASWREAARDPLGARVLVYCLLLAGGGEVRDRQFAILRQHEEPSVLAEFERLARLGPAATGARLPLLSLALPALRTQSEVQYRLFHRLVDALTAADGRVSPFEYALRRVLLRHLAPSYRSMAPRAAQIYAMRGVQAECSCVLSLLAHAGSPQIEGKQAAFARGAVILQEARTALVFLPATECTIGALDAALAVLDRTSPLIKRKFLAACLECLTADGRITLAETELFRAVADALGCPVPPWLAQSDQV